MAKKQQRTLGLKDPFPSSPTRPPRYGIYFQRDHDFAGYQNFCTLYAAHRCLYTVIGDRPYKWVDDCTIETADGELPTITASTRNNSDPEDMEAIVLYKPTKAEKEWQPPVPYPSTWKAIVTGRSVITAEAVTQAQNAPTDTTRRKPKKKRSVRPSGDGYTSLAEICQELDMTPADARKILRKTKTPKPDGGWVWPTDEVDAIKEVLS